MDRVDGVDGVDKLAGLGEGGLLEEPGRVVALFPFGKVGFGNGTAAKGSGKHGLDLGIGVEPGDDLSAFFAVAQADVGLLTNMMGQPGDFALRGVHRVINMV